MRCLGGGNPLNRTCVEGGYMQNKQGRTSGGGRGYKIGSFKQTYFLNDPFRIKTLEAVVCMIFKIGVLKNLANVTGKQLC